LRALSTNFNNSPSWHGPYTLPPEVDDWGQPFVYVQPARYGTGKYDLYSTGLNRVDDHGGGDDITSWSGIPRGHYRHRFEWEGLAVATALIGVGIVLGTVATILIGRLRRGHALAR
jgi:hypothetical protein